MRSKSELTEFISKTLSIPCTSINSFGDGIIYSKLLKKAFTDFPISQISNATSSFEERMENLKVVKAFLIKKKLNVNFQIQKIAQCKLQDNLEFTQWLCNYIEDILSSLDKPTFNSSEEDFTPDIRIIPNRQNTLTDQIKPSNITYFRNRSFKNERITIKDRISHELNAFILNLENERDFYFKKLERIDLLL